jgi:hypothetical protein
MSRNGKVFHAIDHGQTVGDHDWKCYVPECPRAPFDQSASCSWTRAWSAAGRPLGGGNGGPHGAGEETAESEYGLGAADVGSVLRGAKASFHCQYSMFPCPAQVLEELAIEKEDSFSLGFHVLVLLTFFHV